jgi:uncharacterized phage-associated protein
MTVRAGDVAAVLRNRLPGLPSKKLHKLLYYCQGHHLATFSDSLYAETISAWDMGPVVGELWYQEKEGGRSDPTGHLDEAQLNTIGYVVSRYGALTGRDLENLTHSETPWQRADSSRRPGESARIESAWLLSYFSTSGAAENDDADAPLDSDAIRRWLADAGQRRSDRLRHDSPGELHARLSPDA